MEITVVDRVGNHTLVKRQVGKSCDYAVVAWTATNVESRNYSRTFQWEYRSANKSPQGVDAVADWVSLRTARARFKRIKQTFNRNKSEYWTVKNHIPCNY